MNNSDKIRNMTTEELSRFLLLPFSTYVPCKASCNCSCYSEVCRECIEEWLNSEVKQGGIYDNWSRR